MAKILIWFFVFVFIALASAFVVVNYSWVFAKRVSGEILDVQRVTNPTAIMGKTTDEQIHSYAVLIKGEDGKLYTASSDDRQWQVVRRGYCVDATLYVYPPWDLRQSGTYFNARLNQLSLCPGQSAPPPVDSSSNSTVPSMSTPPTGPTPVIPPSAPAASEIKK